MRVAWTPNNTRRFGVAGSMPMISARKGQRSHPSKMRERQAPFPSLTRRALAVRRSPSGSEGIVVARRVTVVVPSADGVPVGSGGVSRGAVIVGVVRTGDDSAACVSMFDAFMVRVFVGSVGGTSRVVVVVGVVRAGDDSAARVSAPAVETAGVRVDPAAALSLVLGTGSGVRVAVVGNDGSERTITMGCNGLEVVLSVAILSGERGCSVGVAAAGRASSTTAAVIARVAPVVSVAAVVDAVDADRVAVGSAVAVGGGVSRTTPSFVTSMVSRNLARLR